MMCADYNINFYVNRESIAIVDLLKKNLASTFSMLKQNLTLHESL